MQGARMQDWDDLRFFLAVVRAGSAVGAARALGVNQTTIARRISQLEERAGAVLFDRQREGYRLREAALPLVAVAEAAEVQAQVFADLAGALGRGIDRIRITSNETLANSVIAPAVQAFRVQHPDVRIELLTGERLLDLTRGEADVALRVVARPQQDVGLVARRVALAAWGAYCSRDYARFHGAPRTPEDLAAHDVLTLDHPSGSHLARLGPRVRSHECRETLNDLCIAARAGLGVVSLPCLLGYTQSDLELCFVQEEPLDPVWLIFHERLRGAPQVRALLDEIAGQAARVRPLLLRGEAGAPGPNALSEKM